MTNGRKLLSYATLLAGSVLASQALAADYLGCTTIKPAKDRLTCFDRFAAAQTAESTDAAEAARKETEAKAQEAAAAATEKASIFATVERFKAVVTSRFKDPSTAQFRNVVAYGVKPSMISFLCGEVNAKNSYGAYTGFKRFVTIGATTAEIEDPKNTFVIDKMWFSTCTGTEIYRKE